VTQYVWGQLSQKWLEIQTGYNKTPTGNGTCGIEWSRDRHRHVTHKGQGREPDIFDYKYLEKG